MICQEERMDFKEGEYIIYIGACGMVLGRIKTITEDGAFVFFSSGETAAKTPFRMMHKIKNQELIRESSLGGL